MSSRAVKQQLISLASLNGDAPADFGSAKQGVKGGKFVKKTRKERKKEALQLKRAAETAAEKKRGLKYQQAISRYETRTQELMRKALGLPAEAAPQPEETDEDLVALFG